MSPAHVIEPACKKLKQMLMQGVWPPGEKLEALRLADELGISMTPVRDCLNRLVGERLVDMTHGEGYRVPRLSEKTLRDMLAVNVALLELALVDPSEEWIDGEYKSENSTYAHRLSSFFDFIAPLASQLDGALRINRRRLRAPGFAFTGHLRARRLEAMRTFC